MLSFLMALGAIIVLAIFYRAVESKWPQSYMAVGDIVSFRISTSFWRYSFFRFGPVLVATFFVSAVVSRSGRDSGLAVLVIGIGHVALTVGRDLIWTLTKRGPLASRVMRTTTDLSVIAGIAVASYLGWLLGTQEEAHGLVPDLKTVAIAFWTALLAAIGGAFLVKTTGVRQPDADELIRASVDSVSEDLVRLAEHEAIAANRDVYLVKAILYSENLQRPSWVRRLERLKGRFLPSGSYGVMQVRADSPLNDQESIRRAVREHLPAGDCWVKGEGPDEDRLDAILKAYNPDQVFVELTKRFYTSLTTHRWDEDYEEEDYEE